MTSMLFRCEDRQHLEPFARHIAGTLGPSDPAIRDLTAALLYSPVARVLTERERADLLDAREAPARGRLSLVCPAAADGLIERYGTADPTAIPALVAAQAWPRAHRDSDVQARLDDAIATILESATAWQLVAGRSGYWVAQRADGGLGRHLPSTANKAAARPATWAAVYAGSMIALPLDQILTPVKARGAILGPLAAWPIDT